MASYAEKMTESTKKAAEASRKHDRAAENLRLQLTGKITAPGQGMSSGVPAGPAAVERGSRRNRSQSSSRWGRGCPVLRRGLPAGRQGRGTHKDAASTSTCSISVVECRTPSPSAPESIQSLATQIADRERGGHQQDQQQGSQQRSPAPPRRRTATPVRPILSTSSRSGCNRQHPGESGDERSRGGGGGGMGQLALQGLNWARKKLEERAARTEAKSGGPDGVMDGDLLSEGAERWRDSVDGEDAGEHKR